MYLAARMPRVAWLALAFVVLSGALLAASLLFLRAEARHSGEERTAALAQVIAEQAARTLQAVDSRLQLGIREIEMLRAAGTLDETTARLALSAQLKDLPFVRAMWVLDPQGRIVLDSDTGNIGKSMADREYFQVYRGASATGFFVGPLVRSRTAGSWLMSASRPMRSADGQLTGVITAAVEPPYFEHLWRNIDLGQTGAVALYNRNGQQLMRSPIDTEAIGRDFSGHDLFRQHLPSAPAGLFRGKSPIDGLDRIVAYRVLPAYPQLLVAVGTGVAENLAHWRRLALLAGGVWAGAVLLAVGLTVQLLRQARRREATERRFRELAQAMPQIVFITDGKGSVRFVNRRWAEVTGRPVEDALDSRWQELVHPADRAGTVEQLRKMLASRQELEHAQRLRTRDGSYRWQLLRAVPFSEAGREWWYGTATDIDDLQQAQARLRDQAEVLKMAGRLSGLGAWRLDLATQRIAWSEEAAALLDMSPDAQPTLQEVATMFTPRSLAETLPVLQECIDRGRPFDVEVELLTPAGRNLWVRSIGQPLFDEEGRVTGFQGAQQDITQRVHMLEEIRQLNARLEEKVAQRTSELARQEALFRTLAEQAPLPFWTVDPAGRPTFFSRAWYELVGGEPPRWHGAGWEDLVHPDDVEAGRANWARSRQQGTVFAGTRRLRARDGTYHTTSYRAVPVRNEAGEIVLWVGIDADITDLMANEAALRLANEQLESFAYSVSHDLQSPLQRIQSFGRLLEEELAAGAAGKARHYLARIRSNADTMAQLVEGLLALAQVSEVEMIRSTVKLSDMATEILQRLQADTPQRRVRWRVQPGLAVTGDVRLMRSVMENLLGNAWKFTSRTPDAEIVVDRSPERGEYFVRDNGAGFDMAYADRLFGTFQRLHDAGEFPGTGIGLASVARAISRQGGRIRAQAAPGQGATFYFTLPPA